MRNAKTSESLELTDKDIFNFDGVDYFTMSGAKKKMKCGKNYILNCINDGTLEVFLHPSGKLFHPDAITEWRLLHTVNGKGKMKLSKK